MNRRDILLGTSAAAGLGLISASFQATSCPAQSLNNLDYLVDAREFGSLTTSPTQTTASFQAALDYCFGSVAAPHGTAGAASNKVLMLPPGHFVTNAPLQVKYLHGGRIIGAGRGVTQITNSTANSDVFVTNGCGYSHFEGFGLVSSTDGTGRCFDLNWDGTAGGPALQSNTFVDMIFSGGSYGVEIGRSGFMGSENVFLSCFWIRNIVAGLRPVNFNALQQSVIGGNFQLCGNGIRVTTGSVPIIHGVGFQESTAADIAIVNSANDSYSIVGCRSESTNFVSCTTVPDVDRHLNVLTAMFASLVLVTASTAIVCAPSATEVTSPE